MWEWLEEIHTYANSTKTALELWLKPGYYNNVSGFSKRRNNFSNTGMRCHLHIKDIWKISIYCPFIMVLEEARWPQFYYTTFSQHSLAGNWRTVPNDHKEMTIYVQNGMTCDGKVTMAPCVWWHVVQMIFTLKSFGVFTWILKIPCHYLKRSSVLLGMWSNQSQALYTNNWSLQPVTSCFTSSTFKT